MTDKRICRCCLAEFNHSPDCLRTVCEKCDSTLCFHPAHHLMDATLKALPNHQANDLPIEQFGDGASELSNEPLRAMNQNAHAQKDGDKVDSAIASLDSTSRTAGTVEQGCSPITGNVPMESPMDALVTREACKFFDSIPLGMAVSRIVFLAMKKGFAMGMKFSNQHLQNR